MHLPMLPARGIRTIPINILLKAMGLEVARLEEVEMRRLMQTVMHKAEMRRTPLAAQGLRVGVRPSSEKLLSRLSSTRAICSVEGSRKRNR